MRIQYSKINPFEINAKSQIIVGYRLVKRVDFEDFKKPKNIGINNIAFPPYFFSIYYAT